MKWRRSEINWRLLKDKIVFRGFRLSDGDSQLFELIGAEIRGSAKAMSRTRRPFAPMIGEGGVSFHCISAADRMRPGCGDASLDPAQPIFGDRDGEISRA